MLKRLGREPALFAAALAVLIDLAVAFGLRLSPEQVGAINGCAVSVAGLWVRGRVTPIPRRKRHE